MMHPVWRGAWGISQEPQEQGLSAPGTCVSFLHRLFRLVSW